MKKTIDEMFLEKIQRIKNVRRRKLLAETNRKKIEADKATAQKNKREKELGCLLKLANENISKILQSPESDLLRKNILSSIGKYPFNHCKDEMGIINTFRHENVLGIDHYSLLHLFKYQKELQIADEVVLAVPHVDPKNIFSPLIVQFGQIALLHTHYCRTGEINISKFQNFEDKKVDAFLRKLSDWEKALDIFAEIIGDISDNEY